MQNLTIDNPSGEDITDFIRYLISEFKEYILNTVDIEQIKRIDQYLNSDQFPYSKKVNVKNPRWSSARIIDNTLKNIACTNNNNKQYQIFIEPEARDRTTGLSYERLMNLIDRGNLTLNPYPLWSQAVDYFDKNIPDMYDVYYEEV